MGQVESARAGPERMHQSAFVSRKHSLQASRRWIVCGWASHQNGLFGLHTDGRKIGPCTATLGTPLESPQLSAMLEIARLCSDPCAIAAQRDRVHLPVFALQYSAYHPCSNREARSVHLPGLHGAS